MLRLGSVGWGMAAGAALLATTQARDARACGGCFVPPSERTTVDAHRMVFSISKTQTILWDQIQYSGAPSEFAWVLPVRDGAKVQLAHDEFIEALDTWTQPVVIGPTPSSGGGVGCGSAASSAYGAVNDGNGVTVKSQEVVGPYEVVTLASTNATALTDWLQGHSYSIPDTIKPTIAAYVNEHFDFIALRLVPGAGISAMQPVRVVTPGADPTLPLRMVAAGVGAQVGVLLYVISEGRYEAANFPDVPIDLSRLTWDKNSNRSNYSQLVDDALKSGNGDGFVTEYSGRASGDDSGLTRTAQYNGGTFQYVWQSARQQSTKCAPPLPDAGFPFTDASSGDAGDLDAAADDAGLDADLDAAVPVPDAGDDGGAGDAGTGYDPCNFDDWDVATQGMNPGDVWITRLRANLPAATLAKDLSLQATTPQAPYDNVHDAPYNDGCSVAGSGLSDRTLFAMGLGGLGVAALLRRRRRSRG